MCIIHVGKTEYLLVFMTVSDKRKGRRLNLQLSSSLTFAELLSFKFWGKRARVRNAWNICECLPLQKSLSVVIGLAL